MELTNGSRLQEDESRTKEEEIRPNYKDTWTQLKEIRVIRVEANWREETDNTETSH